MDFTPKHHLRLIAEVVTGNLEMGGVEVPELDEPLQSPDKGIAMGKAVAPDKPEAAM